MPQDIRGVVILGSTGSIGINTLKVVDRYPDCFKVVGLSALNNHELLAAQARQYRPKYVGIGQQKRALLKKALSETSLKILDAESELSWLVSRPEVDIVVIGMSGSAALEPFLSAARAGKRIAPANKEALVIAGDMIMKEAAEHGAEVIPVDSEQSAVFQCLAGGRRKDLHKVFLTASGGALRRVPSSRFAALRVGDILNHPRWKMGKKITVDSATLMNKGFEVIEAQRLFGLNVEEIEVVIHPEAVIHSMVAFQDGSVVAQLGITDMRLPIQYALTYPERKETGLKPLDFFEMKRLTFAKPNIKKFPSLALAIEVAGRGGTLPSVLNAADEEAVQAFLNERIPFSGIYNIVEKIVRSHIMIRNPGIPDILAADAWARQEARKRIADFKFYKQFI
ncbi:MAG TPA: 1-deoxy-D-xylulose-5-phosphate reductoisomerase [Candidatus Omnitrophota bacterium]|jgi:1-deoxy-D-xylulose-5-phosphate reductoisomerase|nr:1-deoxy-D-xylulose-5-phosphate reductoisomerase [Candidatus Omnitrophota bacterium]HPN55411.1 1-deoxy-D-xylulose-5-phosphate reductoisomerase [Candidatus Omnitrophota bacterium]